MKSFEEANEYLDGKNIKKIKGRATFVRRISDKVIAIRYHETDVVKYYKDGLIEINTGGYLTSTTKRRINTHTNACLYQNKFKWYFPDGRHFYQTAIIDKNGRFVS